LREKDDLPATGTLGEMRQILQALVLRQRAFQEGVERIRVGMGAGI
jgi:hypothetical protein